MISLDALQHDQAVLSQILESRRGVTTVTMSPGVQILWNIYLMILEDALKTISSLISHLTPKEP
jgi:hypothetical protein